MPATVVTPEDLVPLNNAINSQANAITGLITEQADHENRITKLENTSPTPQPTPTSGLYIALYTNPGSSTVLSSTWQKCIDVKRANPNLQMVVAINPASGVGGSQNPAYVNGINKLRAAGIVVIGYVY